MYVFDLDGRFGQYIECEEIASTYGFLLCYAHKFGRT